jgi:pyruvate,orthophosphate dikinase
MMVFGDLGNDSGTGVCFTRDPGTGEKGTYGDYLPRAQGEDVVAGLRNPLTLDELGDLQPECHRQLIEIMSEIETHYTDMCDIEFTIEKGVLYILQTRAGKRTGAAAIRLAVAMANEGLIDRRTAVTRVPPADLEQLRRPQVDPNTPLKPFIHGVPASPGAPGAEVAFLTAAEEVSRERRGAIRFFPDGSATGGGIRLTQNGRSYLVSVHWLTGQVSLAE